MCCDWGEDASCGEDVVEDGSGIEANVIIEKGRDEGATCTVEHERTERGVSRTCSIGQHDISPPV